MALTGVGHRVAAVGHIAAASPKEGAAAALGSAG
jgi:hypothetical protein